ncbi:multiple monosaccharide ABC transporter substrate-binding protein [Streptomyces hainanensis]|uniref:Sugar ABC transporter substrate-binding protein n=1 Tax=Streptomyces hainanensis TaxID=402648 RepID=A0A4R4SIL5_9ACTN|nr:sugar ABC transporter substrate-binding protein [Streptomyces hainanensis]
MAARATRGTRGARRTRGLAVAATLALSLAACGQDSEGGSETERDPEAEGGTVGIAMPTRSSERWIADGENMVAQFEEAGYETDLQYGEDQIENQISQIENMIAQGVDLLVIAAIDGASLGNVLQQAADADIPVVAYDRLLMDTENVDCYASFDNERVGALQGQYIVDSLGLAEGGDEAYNIELFAGSPDDNNTRYFFQGAMGVLQPFLDDGQLTVRSGATELNAVTTERWSGPEAQERMDDLLTAEYRSERLDAVLSPYDGISLGIIAALKNVGYGTADQPLPVVTGQDAELASVQSIIAGEQTQTVFKDMRELAAQAVAMGDALLGGEECEANDTESYDNGVKVVPAFLLDPVSIDAENYQLLVDGGFYTEEQLG